MNGNPWNETIAALWAKGPRSESPAPHAALLLRGSDAADFLQRLGSQDVAGITAGEARPAAFLNPKGRVLALAIVAACEDGFWIETDAGTADALAEHLERFHFREQLTIERPPLQCVALHGPQAPARAGLAAGRAAALPGGGFVHARARAGTVLARWHAPAAWLAESWGAGPGAGAEPLTPEQAEWLRIATGTPRVGTDSDASTLALELPIDDHISTTKGCYTGQEIVARIHTYGHVNRCLRRLAIAGTGPIAPATPLIEPGEGAPIGRVTSAADVPGGGGRAALGFVPWEFEAGGSELRLGERDGPPVQVVAFGPA